MFTIDRGGKDLGSVGIYAFIISHQTFPLSANTLPIFLLQRDILVTAHKRSLRQGNVFTTVCHSVHRGVSVRETLPPYVKERPVRILLECILVAYCFDYPINIAIS